ncbi:MAG TPA: group III truncated hemoglobin [Chitinophagaceae bacterium]|nr:group III truncated hemoglobin [Chitinophagaceae bacterium]
MKKDITNRHDVEVLVNRFYDYARNDEVIGYIFTNVAKVNWEKHLPVMYDFWEGVLFYTGTYNGNPMLLHKQLNDKTPLTATHFQRWLQLFTGTVEELFEGEKAELARQRAMSISTMMQVKILQPDNK